MVLYYKFYIAFLKNIYSIESDNKIFFIKNISTNRNLNNF